LFLCLGKKVTYCDKTIQNKRLTDDYLQSYRNIFVTTAETQKLFELRTLYAVDEFDDSQRHQVTKLRYDATSTQIQFPVNALVAECDEVT